MRHSEIDRATSIGCPNSGNPQAALVVRVCREVDHPFLVKLHYAFATPDKLYLIVDFVQGGELYYHLRNKKSFSVAETQFFLAELALALGKLHELDIIYRDLKPENVLVDHDGHIKLTDFGLAKKDVSEENRPTTFCGTPLYLAPESIKVRAEHDVPSCGPALHHPGVR